MKLSAAQLDAHNFAAHMYSTPYAKLARHPRMIEPIKQVFGEDVYMHQFKINGKTAFDGDVWQWHQDYGTWANDDQMPLPGKDGTPAEELQGELKAA